ncbi:MAG: TfoX/Sxy family protein [Proteobacteria bacterium]|nr:TfoX/Sxy family protein [Pseudomonadota bacterium]
MAYNEELAARVRKALGRRKGLTERKMFGGIAFMLHGHMCCGVQDDELMLRLGPDLAAKALSRAHTRPVDFTGRVMKSMIMVAPAGHKTDASLKKWVDEAAAFVASLPPK